jgi:hypothetical protein
MQFICIRNVSEISHFLTVIEFNTTFEEKRVGWSPQEISTRPTYRNVLTIAFRNVLNSLANLKHSIQDCLVIKEAFTINSKGFDITYSNFLNRLISILQELVALHIFKQEIIFISPLCW